MPDGDRKRRERLLLVAWPSAELAVLHPAIDAGLMPQLRALVERGTLTSLASAPPLTRQCLWTTVATGFLPDRHGVLAPTEIRADGGGVGATGRRSWAVPAIWDVLAANGLRAACVNWPASGPADRAGCLCVDDQFATPTGDGFDDWAMPPHCVSDPALAAALAELRVHPGDDLDAYLRAFVRGASGFDSEAGRARLGALRQALARAVTVQAAASHIAARQDWDALFVFTDFLHQIRMEFGATPDRAFAAVRNQALALLDMMLGHLVRAAGDEATVMLISGNGLRSVAGGRVQAMPRGMMVAAGAGIAADAALPGAALQDVAPTVLARFGLSAASEGQVLAAMAPECPALLPAVWPKAPAEPGWDPAAALLASGYRDVLAPAQAKAMADAEFLRRFHAGIALMSRGALARAALAFEAARVLRPDDVKLLARLVRCRARLGAYASCRELGEALLAAAPDQPWGDIAMASWAFLGAPPEAVDGALAEMHLARARLLAANDAEALVRIGGLALLRGDLNAAVADFNAALAGDEGSVEAAYGAGLARYRLGNLAGAAHWLRRAVVLEHHQPLAHAYLGLVLSAQGRHEEAVAALTTALGQSGGDVAIAAMLTRAQEAQAHAAVKAMF